MEYFKVCKGCGENFVAKRYDHDTCSPKCSVKWTYIKKKEQRIKQLEPKQCIWCGTTFSPKRIDKAFCSRNCAANYDYHAKKGNIEPIDFNKTKVCASCGVEKKIIEFNKTGAKFASNCKQCLENYYRHRLKKIDKDNLKYRQFNLADEFIEKVKSKRYWVDMWEIFELISIIDDIFPSYVIPIYDDQEYIFNILFNKLVEWHTNKKKSIINSV